MPKKFKGKKRKGKNVRLPEPRLPKWKKMVGIGKTAAEKLALLPGPIGVAGKVLSGIANMINVEGKFVDTTITANPDNSTGSITVLTAMAQGTTDQTRSGNSVLSKYVKINGSYNINGSATNSFLRIIVFIDKQNGGGTAPTVAQVLQSADVNAHNNMDNSDRFVVLCNERIKMRLNTDTANGLFECYKDLSDLHTKFDGTTAAQASLAENHVYILLLSNEPTNVPSFNGIARYRFYDN